MIGKSRVRTPVGPIVQKTLKMVPTAFLSHVQHSRKKRCWTRVTTSLNTPPPPPAVAFTAAAAAFGKRVAQGYWNVDRRLPMGHVWRRKDFNSFFFKLVNANTALNVYYGSSTAPTTYRVTALAHFSKGYSFYVWTPIRRVSHVHFSIKDCWSVVTQLITMDSIRTKSFYSSCQQHLAWEMNCEPFGTFLINHSPLKGNFPPFCTSVIKVSISQKLLLHTDGSRLVCTIQKFDTELMSKHVHIVYTKALK